MSETEITKAREDAEVNCFRRGPENMVGQSGAHSYEVWMLRDGHRVDYAEGGYTLIGAHRAARRRVATHGADYDVDLAVYDGDTLITRYDHTQYEAI